jgi:hypothetical protein
VTNQQPVQNNEQQQAFSSGSNGPVLKPSSKFFKKLEIQFVQLIDYF